MYVPLVIILLCRNIFLESLFNPSLGQVSGAAPDPNVLLVETYSTAIACYLSS